MPSSEIDVDFFCHYLTDQSCAWKDEDYKALFMVKAIKGFNFNGHFKTTVGGIERRFDFNNADEFKKICHSPLSSILKNKYTQKISIVPIPSSKTTSKDSELFITYQIGKRLAKAAGDNFECLPLLIFKSEMESSRASGNRDPYTILDNINVAGSTDRDIVLFDDVLTKGAHIQASTWALREKGMNVIGAITFARTASKKEKPAIGPFTESVSVTRHAQLWDF